MDTDAVKHLEGNVSNDDIMGIEKTYCKHSNAAKKICGEHHLTMTQCNKKLDVRRKSKIHSVHKPSRGLESISVVYPALNLRSPSGKKVRPGVVVLSSRMSKRRCRTCPGRDGCIHVSIYDENQNVEDKEATEETEKDEVAVKAVNFLNQEFHYPPTKEETKANNRINMTNDLFKDGTMVPDGFMTDKCECGFLLNELLMESNKQVITHSKPTKDSRDRSLAIYMLSTGGKCDHLRFYSGTKDRLVRTTIAPVKKSTKTVNFVSVDLLNAKVAKC